MVALTVNGTPRQLDVPPDMPLLWAPRDARADRHEVRLRHGALRRLHRPRRRRAGALVLDAGRPRSRASRSPPSRGCRPRPITRVQQAWIEIDVPQCGYCQSGQIMAAAALLAQNPKPTDADIDAAMAGNICRCGTYQRIRAAIHRAAERWRGEVHDEPAQRTSAAARFLKARDRRRLRARRAASGCPALDADARAGQGTGVFAPNALAAHRPGRPRHHHQSVPRWGRAR